jgi:dephospho-CoA kinase
MHKIGITGGIGAGKSTVARIFGVLGIPVYQADHRAKFLMASDPDIRELIIRLLGKAAYLDDHRLNTAWIASQVFSDPWQLSRLNGIVHPAVEKDYLDWHHQHVGLPYTLKEAALIFDAGSYLSLDATIVVLADEAVRIDRVMHRDHLSLQAVRQRIEQQWPESRRKLLADYTIDNNGHQALIPQVLAIHRELSGE